MGEPLIASIVCGAAALSMVWWNWHMMRAQKRKGRKVAIEAARVAGERAQTRRAVHNVAKNAAATARRLLAAPASSRERWPYSSSCLVKLEVLPDCPANTPVDDPSPFVLKAVRERLETAPLSPPVTSPRAAGIGFFKDEFDDVVQAEQAWPEPLIVQRTPLLAAPENWYML